MDPIIEAEVTQKILTEARSKIQSALTERFLVILLDENFEIILSKIISKTYRKNSVDYCPSDFGELLETYKPKYASVFHNHIDFVCYPSENDISSTKTILNECNKQDVILFDDIIIMHENDKYYSNREHNWSGKADQWAIDAVLNERVFK